jgi:hypothetical protein
MPFTGNEWTREYNVKRNKAGSERQISRIFSQMHNLDLKRVCVYIYIYTNVCVCIYTYLNTYIRVLRTYIGIYVKTMNGIVGVF